MTDEIMTELMTDYLRVHFPITRMKIPKSNIMGHTPHKSKGNFKRTIKINTNKVYRVSDKDQRYKALIALSKILSNVFHVHQDDTVPILKKHLHIK